MDKLSVRLRKRPAADANESRKEKAMKQTWTHKVVKVARGMQGQWFDFPTAATFSSESEAIEYAERFAREQAGVGGAKITVRTRKGNCTVRSIPVPGSK